MASRLNGRVERLEKTRQAKGEGDLSGDDYILAQLAAMEPDAVNLLTQNLLIAIGPPAGDEAATAVYRRLTAPGAVVASADVQFLLEAYGNDISHFSQNDKEMSYEDFGW